MEEKIGWDRIRIAWEIGVHPSTVGRELQRNCNSNGEYVWSMPRERLMHADMVCKAITVSHLNYGADYCG